MALMKTVIQDNGTVSTYHRVVKAIIEYSDDGYLNLIVKLQSYFNEEYRQHQEVIRSIEYSFEITKEEEESQGLRALSYNKIKTLEEWQDATDC